MTERNFNCWFQDPEDENRTIYHRVEDQLLSVKTKFQDVKFLRCYGLGELLVLDNKIQSAESDEYIYHEALVQPAMFLHPCPERILVLGGGEGATLREVLRHPTVKRATMVDIDEELVELCKKHLFKWHQGAFDDPRCDVIYGDAWDYLKGTSERFDVIIGDISDPIEGGPALKIYTKEFYEIVSRALNPDGVFATQAVEVFYEKAEHHSHILRTISSVFPIAESYCDYIPSFGAVWGFVIASRQYSAKSLQPQEIANRTRKREVRNLRYYDQETHQRLFSLPVMVREMIRKQKAVATIDHPVTVFS